MDIALWLGVFVVSLAFLIKSSDYFIDYSEKVGLTLGLSPLVIGTLILAFGTSLPELVTSVISVLSGNSEIVLGNVIGSNIANILLIGGIMSLMVRGISFNLKSISIDLLFLAVSAGVITYFVWDQSIVLYESIILLVCFVVYVAYSLLKPDNPAAEELEEDKEAVEKITWKHWAFIIGGGFGIYLGAEYTVRSIVELSVLLDLGKEVIALSAVALGTSLPELVVTIVATRKGNMDLALGNILGSNIFNTFGIVGIPSLLGTLIIPDNVVDLSIPVMLLATAIFIILLLTKRTRPFEGIILLVIYVLFNVELFTGIFTSMLGL